MRFRKKGLLAFYLPVSLSSWRTWHVDTIRGKKPSQTSSATASQCCLRVILKGFKCWMKALQAQHVIISGNARFLWGAQTEHHPLYFEKQAAGIFFTLYLLCEGLLQQPFVIMYLPSNKPAIGSSSSAMVLLPQPQPECFSTEKGMLTALQSLQ